MPVRNIVVAVLIVLAFVAGAIYQKMSTPAQQPAMAAAPEASSMPGSAPASGDSPQLVPGGPPANTSLGLTWTTPASWTDAGERQMRVATYTVPAAGGDTEGGECAVFYFGPGQGGGIDPNIDRWVGQFEHASQPKRASQNVGDIQVKRVELTGDYLAPSGPMMQSTGSKQGWMLLGAIAQGPNGNVFFKLTGPARTLAAARKDFDGLLHSLHKS